jgi:hypothetical protein
VLQPVPRRLFWAALNRDRSTLESFLEGAQLAGEAQGELQRCKARNGPP